MTAVRVYVGRDNRTRLELRQEGELVVANAVTRAQFKFGTWCLDTSEAGDPIELMNNAQAVEMQLGLVTGLTPGTYRGKLTVYDLNHPNGIAWAEVSVLAQKWNVCSAEPGP
jgi:hypothetical protein